MSGIGVVLNPHSRSNRKNPNRADRFGFIVGDKGSCHTTHSLEDVEILAQEFKEKEVEVLALSGGDGTYHHTLTTLINVYNGAPLPKLAFLRGGTMNLVATSLGIKGTPESLLSKLIYRYHQDEDLKTESMPMIKVGNEYGFIMCSGLIYNFLKVFYEKPTPSVNGAAILLSKGIVHGILNTKWINKLARRFDAEILVDGSPWPFKNYTGIICGTVTSMGLGFHALYRGRDDLKKFQIIGFSLPPRGMLLNFPKLMLGKPVDSEDFLDDVASEVIMRFEKPEGYTVDGELYEPVKELTIKRGPVLQVVV